MKLQLYGLVFIPSVDVMIDVNFHNLEDARRQAEYYKLDDETTKEFLNFVEFVQKKITDWGWFPPNETENFQISYYIDVDGSNKIEL